MGRAGGLHADIFKSEVPGADLKLVVDQSEKVAREAGERLGVDWAVGQQEAIEREDIQAVVVAVPTSSHVPVVLSALEAGRNVLVEKPLAESLDKGRELAKRADSSESVVQVGYMRRFDGAYRSAKESVEAGRLGKLILYRAIAHDPAPPAGWASDPRSSGGIFYDMLSHDFDMARYIMSSEVVAVNAVGSSILYEDVKSKGDYDVACVQLTFESGAYGYVEGIRRSPYGYDLRTELVGSEATIAVGSMSDNQLTFADSEGVRQSGVKWFMGRFRRAFVEQDRSFIRSILTKTGPEVSVSDGLRAMEIAEACWTSSKELRPISLEALR